MARSFSESAGMGEGIGVGRALDAGENATTVGTITLVLFPRVSSCGVIDGGFDTPLSLLTLVGERTEPQSP